MDPFSNFAISRVAVAPSPALSGGSLQVTAAQGSRFSATTGSDEFNCTVVPANQMPGLDTAAEIVRCTDRSTDTFTITRAQEGTAARAIAVGDWIYAGITKKTFDDLLALIDSLTLISDRVERILSAAEINSGNTTPISLVPAGGAGVLVVPTFAVFHAVRGTAFSADPGFRLRWNGLTTDLITAISFNLTSAAPPNPVDVFKRATILDWNPGGGVDPRNRALELSTSVDSTGGDGSLKASVGISVVEW